MPKQIILGFLPWILFSAIYGKSAHEILISILIASAVMIKTEWRTLKKGYVLPWGTVVFFIFMFLFAVVFKNTWVINNARGLSNAILALIAWTSLIISKPFTLQYAREQVPQQFWSNPGFIKVNQIITAVWGSIFVFSALLYAIPFSQTTIDRILFQCLMYGAMALGILFTVKFPAYYRNKKTKSK